WFAVSEMTSAAGLTGSQVITIERSDDGELYASLSVVFEAAITDRWAFIAVHDQVATWPGARYAEWDASLVWRPTSGWSVSLGRRWRVGPKPDYGGPWTYGQIWTELF